MRQVERGAVREERGAQEHQRVKREKQGRRVFVVVGKRKVVCVKKAVREERAVAVAAELQAARPVIGREAARSVA